MFPALGENMRNFGHTFIGQTPVSAHGAEPIAATLLVVALLIALAIKVRGQVGDYAKSVIPDESLTLRTFFEIFIEYFYNMMKDVMGPSRAKRYFPVVGTCACFILGSNVLGMIPGLLPPTATWNVTAGCALFVLGSFTYYGFRAQGIGFITHLAGPWMGWPTLLINILIFAIEFLSTFIIRPITLSIRLMLNIAVDHLLLSILLSIFALFLPIPIMILGTLVAVVQVLVFCLLTSIYIALATEGHDDHGGGHDHAHA